MNNEWFCNVLRCHAFVLPKLLDLFGVSSSWSLSVESSGPSRRGASWFRLYRWNQSHTAAQAQNWLHAKTVRMTFIFVWVVFFFLIITGLLALLGLEISLQEWFSTIKYWMRKLQCHFSRRCNPMLRLVWSSTCNTTRFLLQVHRKHQWPNLNCFAYSVTSVAFARHVADCLWSNAHWHWTSTWKRFLPLKSHCSQDPRDIWIHLKIWIAVWPENHVPMNLHLSALDIILVNVVGSHTSESFGGPYLVCNGDCYSQTQDRVWEIHVRLFSIRFQWIYFIPGLCLPVLQQWKFKEFCGNVCEVLKSGLRSFNDRLYFVNLVIHQNSLDFSPSSRT